MENSYRDRAMMLDPSTAKARVFVKNLPLNSITKHDVEDHFGKYGKISGMLLQKHFSFIQFEDNQAAQDAIDNENGQVFHGKILEVAPARMPLDKASLAAQRASRGGGNGGGRGVRDRSPLRDDEVDWRDDPYDYDYRGGGGGRSVRPAPSYREEDYYPETRTMPPPLDERTNDCEIIVHNKKQRSYAEMIERKLKGLGLTVDLLFPNESIPVTRVLANISSRGTLYAITVSPQNEEMHSLTLNILHGIPEEHRNMPLEQALSLINRNFESFVSNGGQRTGAKTSAPLAVSGPAIITPHPDSIQVMLNLLAQNRSVTVLQYDTLLRYLTQRREQQVRVELGDPNMAPAPPLPDEMPSSSVSNPQAELLRNRILNIMQKKGITSTTPDIDPSSTSSWSTNTTTSTPGSSTAPILHDPNVQRALDNLFQGGHLLDKINSARN